MVRPSQLIDRLIGLGGSICSYKSLFYSFPIIWKFTPTIARTAQCLVSHVYAKFWYLLEAAYLDVSMTVNISSPIIRNQNLVIA